MQLILAISENAKQSGLIALKMIGAVIAAAILLYLVLLLSRHGGSALERKKYDKYVEDYNKLSNPNLPLLTYEEFVERRAKGEKVKAGLELPKSETQPAPPQETNEEAPPQESPAETVEPTPAELSDEPHEEEDNSTYD